MTELKNIVSIGSGQVIGSIIGLIFWIYLAKILDVETYGEIHYFLGIAGIAYLIALIGTHDLSFILFSRNLFLKY